MASSMVSEERAFSDVVAALGEVKLGAGSALEQLKRPLHGLLRSELFVFYAIRATLQGIEVTTVGGYSDEEKWERRGKHLRTLPARFRDRWPAYDPAFVEPILQNRVLVTGSRRRDETARRQAAVFAEIAPRFGLEAYDQIGALVCDGPSLLYWVGGLRREPYSCRDTMRLSRLVPYLQRRLRLERALAGEPSLSLEAGILDAFGRAAFLLRAKGTIACSNALGHERWTRDRRAIVESLADSWRSRRDNAPFEITALRDHDDARYFLALERLPPRSTAGQVGAAARRWSLTPRQTDVLRLLVEGRTNWQIAAELGCTERTVEIHVTAILRRAEVQSRAMLVARVLAADA